MRTVFGGLFDEEKEITVAGGGDDGEVVEQQQDGAQDGAEHDGEEGGDEGDEKKVVKKTTAKPRLTEEQIIELAAKAAGAAGGRRERVEEEPRMTQEEIDKLLNPVKITKEDMAEILGIEDPNTISDKRLAKYQAILQATVKNANSVTNVMLETRMRKLMEQAAPMEGFYRQQAAKQQEDAFYTRHENLKKYPRLVKAAASQVVATKDMTVEQAMDAVADMTRSMLKDAGIDPDAETEEGGEGGESGSTAKHGADGVRPVPKMTSLQKSGRGGGPTKTGGGNNPDADIYK